MKKRIEVPQLKKITILLPQIVVAAVALNLSMVVVTADERVKETSAAFFEPYRVPLVSVEVVVTDKKGVPIRGLTRDDFEVFEDDVPVEISHFFAADTELTRITSAAPRQRLPEGFSQDLYLAMYFDDSNIEHQRRTSALNHLRSFLQQPLPPNVKAMLVRYDGSLHIETGFSDNTDDLIPALEHIMAEPAVSSAMSGTELLRRMQTVAASPEHQLTSPSAGGRPVLRYAYRVEGVDVSQLEQSAFLPQIRAYAESQNVRNRASLEALDSFIGNMQAIPGRKVVLWVGGLEMRAGENLFRSWQELFPDQNRRQPVNLMLESMKYDLSPDIQRLADRANANRTSLYTLRSLANVSTSSAETNQRIFSSAGRPGQQSSQDVRSQDDALMVMSDLTGGRALSDNNQLDKQLVQVSEDLAIYYSLAYTPPTPGDLEQHKIRVKVNREDVLLRYRQSYRDSGEKDKTAERTLAAGMLGIAENPLGISIECQEQEARDDKTFLVPVKVSVPIGELVLAPVEGRHEAQISFFSVVYDEANRSSDVYERTYPIEIDNDQLLSAIAQEAKFIVGMVLRKGPHRIAVSIRDDLSSSESTAIVDVVVGPESRQAVN